MPDLNIADAKGRDAVVAGESVTRPSEVRWLDAEGAQAESRKILRHARPRPDACRRRWGRRSGGVRPGDRHGSFGETSRVYINRSARSSTASPFSRSSAPDGGKERRPKVAEFNTNPKWTGKMMKKGTRSGSSSFLQGSSHPSAG
ncbi:MAG: hypothetical protein R3F11_19150 [Verrucomicrobiales bacterium]